MKSNLFIQNSSPRSRLARRVFEPLNLAKKLGIGLVATAVLALALVSAATPSAMAATGYSTYSGSTWNVRSCPATCGVMGTISGSIPNLVCQTSGPAASVSGFGTSTIYDLVRMPSGTLGYMSDLGVQQTPYGQFSPNLPRCTAGPGPATEAATNSGYGWIATCTVSWALGRVWACWAAGLRYLFVPGSAS
jgi:hypothetical protein